MKIRINTESDLICAFIMRHLLDKKGQALALNEEFYLAYSLCCFKNIKNKNLIRYSNFNLAITCGSHIYIYIYIE